MKGSKLLAVLVLLSLAWVMSTAQARPKPADAADFLQKQAAWEKHQDLVASSPYAGLKWRSVGPVVQGGRHG